MRIYRAIYTNWITQGFGPEKTKPEMLLLYQSLGLKAHNGVDFAAGDGQKIHWDCDIKGEVLNTHIDGKGGLGVEVLTNDKDGMFIHRFWHLKSFACQTGQKLDSGDLIGYADSTGWSTGNHLHRDLKKVKWDSNGNYESLEPNNGYFGAIDMTPYFTNIWIVDYVETLKKQISILEAMINIIKLIIKIRLSIKRRDRWG